MYGCSTEITEDSILPVAPSKSNYSTDTNAPANPYIIPEFCGTYASLKSTISWVNDDTALSFDVYRNNVKIASINKKTTPPEKICIIPPFTFIYCYFYEDTAPADGTYNYSVKAIGTSGKTNANTSLIPIACSNHSVKGNLAGTYYTTGYHCQKIYIGNASLIATNLLGTDKVAYTRTDANGNFSITSLPEGHYTLYFSHPAYPQKIVNNILITNNITTSTSIIYP